MADNTAASLKKSKEPQDIAKLVDDRLMAGIAEASEWGEEAQRAQEYYQSHQWDDMTPKERFRIIPIIANVIRRDVDQLVSQVLDAEPVINPKGRHGQDYEMGKMLVDVLGYTRDEEVDWFNDLEDVITDCFHTGEGILEEGWDQQAGQGLGLPRAQWRDNRYVVWDREARHFQRDDAEWITTFIPAKVDYLQEKYADKLGSYIIDADFPGLHISEEELAWHREYQQRDSRGEGPAYADLEPKAYEKIQWSKKIKWEPRYLDANGRMIIVPSEEGRRPMNKEEFGQIDKATKKDMMTISVEVPELWRTVIINSTVVENEISRYDRSRGGHGEYPFAFFSYVRLRNRTHAKGEIDYLVGLQDLINRSLARWLEQMMIAGSHFVTAPKGSLPAEDEEKLHNLGNKPLQVLRPYPGMESPRIEGGNPTGANLFDRGFTMLTEVKDQVSGVYAVQRGDMPYQTSGRGIRALQSATDLLGTIPRRHIESGLKQATILRLGNIAQLMRGSRIAEVVDSTTKEIEPLYVGESMAEVQQEYQLPTMVDPKTGKELADLQTGAPLALMDPDSQEQARVIILNNDTAKGIDLRKIQLELDTGKERNREERQAFAEMVLQQSGAAAIPWAMELLEAPNKDQLIESLQQNDAAQGFLAMLADFSKQTGMPEEEIMQAMREQLQAAAAAQQQGPPQGAPQGAPPAGPPQGGPPPGAPPGPQQAGPAPAPQGAPQTGAPPAA